MHIPTHTYSCLCVCLHNIHIFEFTHTHTSICIFHILVSIHDNQTRKLNAFELNDYILIQHSNINIF